MQLSTPKRNQILYVILQPHNHFGKVRAHVNSLGTTKDMRSKLAQHLVGLDAVISQLQNPDGERYFVKLGADERDVATYFCEPCNQTQIFLPNYDLERLAPKKRVGIIRKYLLSNNVLVVYSIIAIMIGLVISFHKHDFVWFTRSGVIVLAFGLTLLSRYILLGRTLLPDIYIPATGLSQTDLKHYEKLGVPVPPHIKADHDLKLSIEIWGPLISFVGTLICGFGDLFNRMIQH